MDQKPYPAENARGGEIILNTPFSAPFLSGLIGAIGLAIIPMLVRLVRHFAVHRNDHVVTLFPSLHSPGETA